jgi:hypothetical protein
MVATAAQLDLLSKLADPGMRARARQLTLEWVRWP